MADFAMFFSQAFAIVFEESVVKVGKRLGMQENRITRTFGYGWTALVVTLPLRFWINEGASRGAHVKPPFEFSPVEIALRGSGIW